MPSTVVTEHPITEYAGHRHALTALCSTTPSVPLEDNMTVQAPHPPSPHPSFVPVRPWSACECIRWIVLKLFVSKPAVDHETKTQVQLQ
jgi:hypothetical protein